MPDQNPPEQNPKARQVALITGAARRIGASIAGHLHARGLQVLIHCRASRQAADALAAKLNARRADSAQVVCADLADLQALRQLAGNIAERNGRLDVLVHNASQFYPTPLASATPEDWTALMDSNARGALFLTQQLESLLRESQGSIVSIVDIHVDRPLKEHTVYCMAKSALQTMTRSLAKELAPEVRVNGVAPGAILWPEQGLSERAQATILERIPLQRSGSPDDIAAAVAFLALDAPYITGQILAVDGGRSLFM